MAAQSKTREQVAEMFLSVLKEHAGDWKKCWSSSQTPQNALTNNRYRGINHMMLAFVAYQKGYTDHRWCTFKQASDEGWKIKKGEKATPIEYWFFVNKETKKSISGNEYRNLIKQSPEEIQKYYLTCKTYSVFNAAQIEGIPELQKLDFQPIAVAEQFLDNLQEEMGIDIVYGGGRACYIPSSDSIHLPEKADFHAEQDFYLTAFHEFGHSTGHASRLDRDLSGTFGTPLYAMEELRAEIASCMMANDLQLPVESEHDRNHKAYVANWIERIEKEPKVLFEAIRDAEKITNFLGQKGNLEQCLKLHQSPLACDQKVKTENEVSKTANPKKNIARMAALGKCR